MGLRYRVGMLLESLGFRLVRLHAYPRSQGALALLELGCAALTRQRAEEACTLVQVGAFDGEHQDPAKQVIDAYPKMRKVLVEPQDAPFRKLQEMYGHMPNLTLMQVAVSDRDGDAELYVPRNEGGGSPKASLNPLHHKRFGDLANGHGQQTMRVQTRSVPTLLREARVERVDVLQIDTEGHDFKILAAFFEAGQRPSVIAFENLHLSKQERHASRALLCDYIWIETDQDTYAVGKDVLGPPAARHLAHVSP